MEPNLTPADTRAIVDKLRGAQPWLRFIGIMCWIAMGTVVVVSAILLLLAASGVGMDSELERGQMALGGIVYGLMSLLYVYPAILLLRAARHIRNLGADAADIVGAIDAQRRLWKYIGIYLIVAIALVVLLSGIGLLAAVGRAVQS